MKQFLLIVLFLVSISLSAKESGYSLSVALVGMSMDYREYDDAGVILDSEKSAFNELGGAEGKLVYTKVLANENYAQLGINVSYLRGTTEYIGSLLNPNGPSNPYGSYVSVTANALLNISVNYNFVYTFDNSFELGYGFGFGYNSWRRELSASQIEIYRWYSVRPNILVNYHIYDFRLGVKLEYQYGINPKMDILANAENSDTTVNLGSANTFEIILPITYSINKKLEIFCAYVYSYQDIEKSNVVPYIINGSTIGVLEPDSTAHNQFMKLGATFKF